MRELTPKQAARLSKILADPYSANLIEQARVKRLARQSRVRKASEARRAREAQERKERKQRLLAEFGF